MSTPTGYGRRRRNADKVHQQATVVESPGDDFSRYNTTNKSSAPGYRSAPGYVQPIQVPLSDQAALQQAKSDWELAKSQVENDEKQTGERAIIAPTRFGDMANTFSFGQQSQQGSSGGQSKSLFSTAPTTTPGGGSLFGNTATSGGGGGGGLFGNTPAGGSNPFAAPTSSGGGAGGLFGTTGSGSNTPNPFGGAGNRPSSVFGSGNPSNSGTPPPTSSSSNAPPTSAPNLFGNTGGTGGGFGSNTPTTTGGSSWSFGGLGSNTTSSAPSSGGVFGSAPTPNNTTSGSGAPSGGSGLFSGNANAGSSSGTTPSSIFGTSGAQNKSTSSIFSSGNTGGTGGTPASSAPSGGLFQNLGGGSRTRSGTTTPQPARSSGLTFSTTPAGNPPSNASNMFGGAASTSTGQAPITSSAGAPGGGSLFNFPTSGTSATSAGSAPSIPAGTSAGGGGSLFGEVNSRQGAQSPFSFPASGSTSGSQQPSGTATSGAPPSNIGGSGVFGGQTTGSTGQTSNLFSGGNQGSTPSAPTGRQSSNLFSGGNQGSAPSSSAGGQSSGIFSGQQNTSGASGAQGGTGTASNLFSNLGGGGASASIPQAGTAATATSSAPSLFGAAGTGSSQPPTSSGAPAAANTTGGLFGATTSPGPAGASASTTAAPAAPAAPATTGTSAPPTQSRLAGKTMDEILTTWSTSLAQHQKTFASLAQQVSTWDRMLVENAGKITTLYGRCFQAERDVAEVERQLSSVEHGQVELESVLERYEGWVDEILEAEGVGEVGGVDGERERTYKTAELCANRLTDMGHNLTSMIEEINVASGKLSSNGSASNAGQRPDDPLAQIVRVLNGHLQQLQAIDAGAADLGRKVEQAQREARSLERGQGIRDQGWVEGFGRSYLGRS